MRAQSQPEISAESTDTDLRTGETIFKGGVQLRDQGLFITADELRYNNTTNVATAIGHIVFTRGETRLLADHLVYNRTDGTFTAENIRVGRFPYYAEGFSAYGTRTEITVKRAHVTYGEPGPWQPTLKADTIIYTPGQRLRTENSQAGIGHVQPLPFPKFQQSLSDPVNAYVSLTGGYRPSLGAFAEVGLHLPVALGVMLGGDLGIYTNRGVMFGPSGTYAQTGDEQNFRGSFRSGFINDHGEKKTDILGRPVPENRGYVEWRHDQLLAENLTLTAQLNWWKDSEILRDFRPRAFFPVQEPDTFVESVYAGANYFVSAFARFQPNAFNRIQERLPEIRFDLLPLAVGSGFYERFNASAAVLREDPPLGGPELRSTRLDGYYALSRPIAPSDWFTFTPVAGGRVTHYASTTGAVLTGNYTRVLGEVGADAALRTSAVFDYKNPQWKIDGLRHLMTPRVSYRYSPEAEQGRRHIPMIDRRTFATYLQPLGLGDTRNLDDLHATNTLRLGVDNVLQTRDTAEGSRDLLVFNVASDFRFKRARGERDVSEIHTELALTPVRWLQFDVYESFAPQNFTLREFNSGLTIRDGDAWSVRFSNDFLRHQIEDYHLEGRRRLSERYDVLTRLRYDARKNRFNEQAYGLVQNLDNTWRISYVVSLYAGPRRESHFGFNVQIDAIRF